jgi:hypothetical protein
MKRSILFAAVLVLASATLAAADAGKDPNEMSLSLYQKIKAHFDVLYGVRATLLPGVQPPGKAEVEKKLREDAAANKDALVKALQAGKAIHRELAARALEYCGDKKLAVELLCGTLVNDTDEQVRRAAAAALAKLADAASVEALVKGLSDASDAVRGVCVTALGNVKDNRASEPLLRMLRNDAKPLIRMQAATALSKIKDPATLEPLKSALESEKDERVKMAIAGAIRALSGGNTAQTEQLPTPEETVNEMMGLAKEMREVEDKLRNDRHDQAVQGQGKGIEEKLAMLAEKLAKASQNSSSNSQDKDKQQQQQKQKQQGNQANDGRNASNPLNDSKLGGAVPPGSANSALVSGKQDAWAKLPPAQRDELLQAYREEMPERWKKRLEAYYLSITSEEFKNEK